MEVTRVQLIARWYLRLAERASIGFELVVKLTANYQELAHTLSAFADSICLGARRC